MLVGGMEFLHKPEQSSGEGLVLTHGSGGNCRTPLLSAVAEAFCDAGVTVLRYDLPFRQRRWWGPPSPATAAADRDGLREAVARVRTMVSGPVYLGGHSYGGRQSAMLAAEDPAVTEGLLLLSYPLHPPGKPEQPRTAHFPALRTPALFIHGPKDDYGTIDEVRTALGMIPGRTILIPVEGAGHDLKRGKFDIAKLVVAELRRVVGG